MNSKAIRLGCIFLITAMLMIPVLDGIWITTVKADGSNGTTLYVGGSGPGNYTTIQSAIDNASHGGTIFVYDGVYYENVDVYKSLTIQSKNGPALCIVYAPNYNDHAFEIAADNVTIQGFTVKGTISPQAAIYLTHSEYCNILGNIASSNSRGIYLSSSSNNTLIDNVVANNIWEGIFLEGGSDDCTITGNVVNGSHECIKLSYSDRCTITGNTVTNSSYYGINIGGCKDCTIAGNYITNSSFFSIRLEYSTKNTVTGNIITNNDDSSISIAGSNSNTIKGNTLKNINIRLSSSDGCIITENTFRHKKGKIEISGTNNYIYHNNFFSDSIFEVHDEGSNTWDDGYPSGGNYWEGYAGIDTNGDHIGDTPYYIKGGNNLDRYPLMIPYNFTINQLPTCTLSSNHIVGTAPLTVTFTMTANDRDGSISSWKLDTDNDGNADYSGTGNPPSTQQHIYQTERTYTAKLTVIDNDGATDSDTRTITVSQTSEENKIPIANFDISKENLKVTFQDKSTDSDGNITNWYWDFGDGTSSELKNPIHTYNNEDTYNITLTVTDNNGDTDTYSKIITVTEEEDGGDDDSGIPGFEFLPLMVSFLVLLFLSQRKRKHGCK